MHISVWFITQSLCCRSCETLTLSDIKGHIIVSSRNHPIKTSTSPGPQSPDPFLQYGSWAEGSGSVRSLRAAGNWRWRRHSAAAVSLLSVSITRLTVNLSMCMKDETLSGSVMNRLKSQWHRVFLFSQHVGGEFRGSRYKVNKTGKETLNRL